jgi:6-phosphogluconolactonase
MITSYDQSDSSPEDIARLAFFAFDSREDAFHATAEALARSVRSAFDEGRRARIALSGGSSPAPAYQAFANLPLDWSQIDIALVDDRWVDLVDKGSNEAMIRTTFSKATGVKIFGMKTPHAHPRDGISELETIYASLLPFDAIVLGMGPDAHTASWFVGSPQLSACLSPTASATVIDVDASAAPISGDYPLRMTLTLPPVAQASHVILLVFGADKRQVLTDALDMPVTQAPIRAAIEACEDRLVVFWAD